MAVGLGRYPRGVRVLMAKLARKKEKALSHKLSFAVVKPSLPNWGGRIEHVNEKKLLSGSLPGLAFCHGHLRQVHFEIES